MFACIIKFKLFHIVRIMYKLNTICVAVYGVLSYIILTYMYGFQVENSIATYEPHACIVVYSVVSRGSLKTAEEILNYLWQENYTREKIVIVVGNKADLMRARCITTEGNLK